MASALRPASVLVLLAAAAAPAQGDELQRQIQAALDRARPLLLRHLQQLGGGRGPAPGATPGVLALSCLAALHDGIPADDRALAAALERLARADLSDTYELSLRLMVLEAHAGFPDRVRLAERDTERLLRCRTGGLFSYRFGNRGHGGDLSNTQYGALGLRAAASIGVKIEPRVWHDLLAAVVDMQDYDGGFGYSGRAAGRGRVSNAYPSMTVAGIAVLEICDQATRAAGRRPAGIAGRIAKAWDWMGRQAAAIGNPDTRACYYFHYGLERAAILSDRTEVGGRDWYRTGAEMMVHSQLADGGWRSRTDLVHGLVQNGASNEVVTAFAVLFLRRAFQRVAGPITGPRGPSLAQLAEQSSDADVTAAARLLAGRGMTAMEEILKALWSEVRPRRRAAASALTILAGQDFGYDPLRDPDSNRAAIRAAELWYLRNRAGPPGK